MYEDRATDFVGSSFACCGGNVLLLQTLLASRFDRVQCSYCPKASFCLVLSTLGTMPLSSSPDSLPRRTYIDTDMHLQKYRFIVHPLLISASIH